ncbi:MAG: hypothetical protein JWL77_4983 [Chthonomonadaceae bacterium]|nr:hypothetical protein [Chthonomonadaceae bacterium]
MDVPAHLCVEACLRLFQYAFESGAEGYGIARSFPPVAYLTLSVDENRDGNPLHIAEGILNGYRAERLSVGDAMLTTPLTQTVFACSLANSQTKKIYAPVVKSSFCLNEVRDLLKAGRTPGSPEIEHGDASALLIQLERLALDIRELDGRRWITAQWAQCGDSHVGRSNRPLRLYALPPPLPVSDDWSFPRRGQAG